MRLKVLRWLTVILPLLFLVGVDIVRQVLWPDFLHSLEGTLFLLAAVAIGIYLFSDFIFRYIETIQSNLTAQNRALHSANEIAQKQATQLHALHEAGLALVSNLSLEAVLQQVVEQARQLSQAHFGALGVLDEHGSIVRFLTAGIREGDRAGLGDPPKGRGLLGAVLSEGRPIRVDNLSRDPRSIGFPPGHPAMTTFLGVPIMARGRILGNLYLTDKAGPDGIIPFNAEDEALLQLFAAQAAIAIENARLYSTSQALAAVAERERIARELHDSLAQVLGYIRMQLAAIRPAVISGKSDEALAGLSRIDSAAEEAYADVREAILGLRSGVGAERDLAGALALYLERYCLQTGVKAELELGIGVRDARLAPAAEAQLLRIIQEALSNVRKHAAARKVIVRLEQGSNGTGAVLRASVVDDGLGFDAQRPPGGVHFGLATMRERAEAAAGYFQIESAPLEGTRVTVEIPIESIPATLSSPSAMES